jgi:hypothetical protein
MNDKVIEDIKKSVAPTLALLKELNNQMKSNDLQADCVLKLATTMKVSAMGLERAIKQNKLKVTGGVEYIPPTEEDDDEDE